MNTRKTNNKRRKEDILRLRKQGKSFGQISKQLGCSKSVISYHCGNGSEKARVARNNKSAQPICKKVNSFKSRCSKSSYDTFKRKLKGFKRKGSNNSHSIVNNISKNYSCKDVVEKIGKNPRCYLTGKKINLEDTSAYHLDHITPTAKGGSNDLDNLNICLAEANQAKGQLTLKEFYKLCEDVLKWRGKCKK